MFNFLHHLRSVHSILNRSYSFSHLNVFACLILVTFSHSTLWRYLNLSSIPVSRVSSLNICTVNIRSFTNPLLYTAIADLADTHDIDVFALPETWISPNATAQLFDVVPRGYTFINTPRLVPNSFTSSIVGGGTSFLLREPCKLLFTHTTTVKSFKLSSIIIKLLHSNLALYNIYRPPQSTSYQFLEDFQTPRPISSVSSFHQEFHPRLQHSC